ncbi:PKD domain-containing protein, partial [Gemmatimonadota bacterium]
MYDSQCSRPVIRALFLISILISVPSCVTRPENEPPAIQLTISPAVGDTATVFSFDLSGSSDREDGYLALEARWDWEGDGEWDTEWALSKTTTHIYQLLGTWPATVQVRDTEHLTGEVISELEVARIPIPALYVSYTSASIDTTFTFDASASRHPIYALIQLEARWDLDGDSIWDGDWGSQFTCTHDYTEPGNHVVTLQLRDPDGLIGSISQEITVHPSQSEPVASFTVSPEHGLVYTVFDFNAEGSSDPRDPLHLLTFRWDWEDDSVWDSDWSYNPLISHRYPTDGEYLVRLAVRDSDGLISTMVRSVKVGNEPPQASFGFTPSWGSVLTTFTLDPRLSSDPDTYPWHLQIRWDWEGDGTWDTGWGVVQAVEHLFENPGEYHPTLQIRDYLGALDSTTMTIDVKENALKRLLARHSGWWNYSTQSPAMTASGDIVASSDNILLLKFSPDGILLDQGVGEVIAGPHRSSALMGG